MKITKNNKIVLSQAEEQFIKDNFDTMTNPQLADALGLKLTSLRTRAYALGLKRIELAYWTEKQTQYLKDNYKKIGDTEIAEYFEVNCPKNKPWTKRHIEKKRRYLKLKRTAAQLKEIHKRNVKLGMFAMCSTNMWKTRGISPEGTIVTWFVNDMPYLFIKQNDTYIHYNRYLYEKEIGKIPKGMLVRIADDADRTNYTAKDLFLVTRGEHAILNSKIRLPEELKETSQLIKQLNKVIIKTQSS